MSLGAGVQSSTLYLMALQGETEFVPQVAIFCDTLGEPQKVYKHLEFLKSVGNHKIPIKVVTAGNLMENALDLAVKRFTSLPLFVKNPDGKVAMIRRQCTNEYKVAPFKKEVYRLIGKNHRKNSVRKWLGISTDESNRMRLSSVKYIQNYYPLIDKRMNRFDCMSWCERNGYPIPPKSSCIVCPFHSDEYWQELKDESPEEFELACQFDEKIRWAMTRFTLKSPAYLHRQCIPLREVNFSNKQQTKLFTLECSGSCFN